MAQASYHIKGSTTSKHKLESLKDIGIEVFLVDIDQPTDTIDDFLSSETLIVNIPSKNLKGFMALIERIEKSPIKNVLFISSTSVYGDSKDLITEETPRLQTPLSEIEDAFVMNTHFQCTTIRFAGLVGYDSQAGMFFASGRKIPNPSAAVNMIHQDDCIQIIASVLKQDLWNESLNCCTDSHPTKKDFYTKMAIDIGLPPPQLAGSSLSGNKIIDNSKMKRLLAYEFIHKDLLNMDPNK